MKIMHVLSGVCLLPFLAMSLQADLIINPGFETGDLTGWSTFGQGWRVSSGGDAYEGSFGLVNDVQTTDVDEWRGVFQNVSVTAGDTYSFGAYIRAVNIESSDSWLELQWLDGGGGVIGQQQTPAITADQPFTYAGLNNVVAPAGAAAASIRGIVHMVSAPVGGTEFFIFDQFTAVPEPGTASLIMTGILGSSLAYRRRRMA